MLAEHNLKERTENETAMIEGGMADETTVNEPELNSTQAMILS